MADPQPPDPQNPQRADPFYSFGQLLASLPVEKGRRKPDALMPPQQSAQPELAPRPEEPPAAPTPDPAHPMPEVEWLGHAAQSLLTSPYTGAMRALRGAYHMGQELQPFEQPTEASQAQPPPQNPRKLAGGAADILGGTMEAGTMLLPEALAAKPVAVGTGLAVGTGVGSAIYAAGERFGVPREYVDLAAQTLGLAAGIAAGHVADTPELRTRLFTEAKRLYTDQSGEVRVPGTGAAEEPPADRGLYSRVDDVANALPEKGVHPNKVASLFKSGASQEELAYRKVPEFLAGKGQGPVTRAELQAHLAANPAPFPETVRLGEPPPRVPTYNDYVGQLEQKYGEGYNEEQLTPEEQAEVRRRWQRYQQGDEQATPRTPPTKYQQYSLPGGENYREQLLTLPPELQHQGRSNVEVRGPDGAVVYRYTGQDANIVDGLRAMYEPDGYTVHAEPVATPVTTQYREGHYGGDYPNVLVHTRTTERGLPVDLPTTLPENYQVHQDPRNGRFYYQTPEGTGAINDHATAEQATRAAMEHAGLLNPQRGRFLEEVQSDWHQRGKREGYQQPPTPEQQQRIADLTAQLEQHNAETTRLNQQLLANREAFLARQEAETRALLPRGYEHLQSFDQALREGESTREAWRAARKASNAQSTALQDMREAENVLQQQLGEHIARNNDLARERGALLSPTGVPNAPFKEAWPDLALKQHLLDVARDPDSHWLGFTGGKTQAARYDLSKQVSRIIFEPEEAGDFSLGSLVAHGPEGHEVLRENRLTPDQLDEYIGKEPAHALRREIASKAHDAEQWTVGHNEADPSDKSWYVIDPNGEIIDERSAGGWNSRDMAERQRQEIISGQYYSDYSTHPEISGLDLQVGGEGMTHFYDNLLPARLRKLVKPFGGTVEPFDLPTSQKKMDLDVPAFSVRDQNGHMRGVWENRADAEAYLRNPPDFIDPTQSTIVPTTTVRQTQVPHTEPSWITHLTPEMKREILRRGFPLLTLPLAAAASSLASRPGAQIGTPPPVEREPPPQR